MAVNINQAKVFPLDTEALNLKINRLNIKRYFLASSLHVSEMTVNRWMTGKTRNIRSVHLKALADILKCKPEELIRSKAYGGATTTLQRRILGMIIEDEKFAKLAVDEEYDLLEANLEISFNMQFDAKLRHQAFYHLAVCSYKRQLPGRALDWLDELLLERDQLRDQNFLLRVLQLRAAMFQLQGKFQRAEKAFADVFATITPEVSGEVRYLAYSNYGYLKYCQEQYSQSRESLQQALRFLGEPDDSTKTKLNLCSTIRLLAEVAVVEEDSKSLQGYLSRLKQLAADLGHHYTECRILLLESDLKRLAGDLAAAWQMIQLAIETYPEKLDEYFLKKAVFLSCELGYYDRVDELAELAKDCGEDKETIKARARAQLASYLLEHHKSVTS